MRPALIIMILLEKKKYTGPLDINGIVSKGRFYGLEFSARFGFNALYALLPLLREDFGDILHQRGTTMNKDVFRTVWKTALKDNNEESHLGIPELYSILIGDNISDRDTVFTHLYNCPECLKELNRMFEAQKATTRCGG